MNLVHVVLILTSDPWMKTVGAEECQNTGDCSDVGRYRAIRKTDVAVQKKGHRHSRLEHNNAGTHFRIRAASGGGEIETSNNLPCHLGKDKAHT